MLTSAYLRLRRAFSASFRTETICAFEYRDFFMVNLLGISCRENSSFQHNHFSGGLPPNGIGAAGATGPGEQIMRTLLSKVSCDRMAAGQSSAPDNSPKTPTTSFWWTVPAQAKPTFIDRQGVATQSSDRGHCPGNHIDQSGYKDPKTIGRSANKGRGGDRQMRASRLLASPHHRRASFRHPLTAMPLKPALPRLAQYRVLEPLRVSLRRYVGNRQSIDQLKGLAKPCSNFS